MRMNTDRVRITSYFESPQLIAGFLFEPAAIDRGVNFQNTRDQSRTFISAILTGFANRYTLCSFHDLNGKDSYD